MLSQLRYYHAFREPSMTISPTSGRVINHTPPSTLRGRKRRSSGQPDSGQSPRIWTEISRLLADQDNNLQRHLDAQVAEQEAKHVAALNQAALEHERVRNLAESARQRVELEIEREHIRRQTKADERLEASRLRRAAAELEKTAAQARRSDQQQELNQQKLLQQKAREDANARAAADAKLRQEQDEADAERERRQDEQTESLSIAKARARQAVTDTAKARAQSSTQTEAKHPVAQETTPPQNAFATDNKSSDPAAAFVTTVAAKEALHKQYLDLHAHLKLMRKHVIAECRQMPALKTKLGDWRRQITKSMGQLTQDKIRNKQPILDIMTVLKDSLQHTQPAVDVTDYMLSQTKPIEGRLIMSGAFVYLVNILSKSVISQFITECAGGFKAIDPIGVTAATIFATPTFQIQGLSLIDILLSKFHKTCPVLFGISGDEKTIAGRIRSGWQRDPDSNGRFVDEERHKERMAGIAAGYAAIALRDFQKSKNENPLPNTNYWQTFAALVNVSQGELQPSHYTVLRGLITGFVPRFIGFYGGAAVAALRCAIVDLPTKVPPACRPVAAQLAILKELCYNDLRLTL